MSTDVADRVAGSILGLAWGDVFGCPVEGWPAARIETVYGAYNHLPSEYPWAKLTALGPKILRRLRPLGLHSDDTQQALALLNVTLDPSGWSRERWANLLADGMRQKAWRGYGRNFADAVRKLMRGTPPTQSGSSSAGIGAAMRIAPLGAVYRNDPALLARVTFESTLITHGDTRAAALAHAVAYSAAVLSAGGSASDVRAALAPEVSLHEAHWLKGEPEWAIERAAGPLVSQAIKELFAQRLDRPDQIREAVVALAAPYLDERTVAPHPNKGFVLLGGLHALAAALCLDDDPVEILRCIVAQGDDTDTVAAICGGLLGARFGTGWIPLDRLLDRKRLESYATALAAGSGPPEDRLAFLSAEHALTRLEQEFQAALAAHQA